MKILYKPIFLTLLLLIFIFSCNNKTTDPTSNNGGNDNGNITSKFDPSEVEILIPVTYYLTSRVSGNLTSFKSVQSETGKTVYEIPITFNDERLLDEIDYIRVSYKGVNVRETALTEYRKEDLGDYLKTYLVSLTNESSGEVNELYLGLYTELQFSKYMVKHAYSYDAFSLVYNDTLNCYTNSRYGYYPLSKYDNYNKEQLKKDTISAFNEYVAIPSLDYTRYYPRYDYEFIGDFLVEDNVADDEINEWMRPAANYKRLTFKVKPRAFKGYRFTDKENIKEYSVLVYLKKDE